MYIDCGSRTCDVYRLCRLSKIVTVAYCACPATKKRAMIAAAQAREGKILPFACAARVEKNTYGLVHRPAWRLGTRLVWLETLGSND